MRNNAGLDSVELNGLWTKRVFILPIILLQYDNNLDRDLPGQQRAGFVVTA